mmetsp:Transcript_22232/g.36814  ORF Transcript_22232/g.36814 Transcript_22232/m.36814 type:complete len:251 (-) Transcript_22232:418-1170(-)|eukprot:CAMPEP_0119006040 /NCGR_PEP_ID=MMETSP1176-20130426/2082_1 /TAXON_ID=265551 /ORGANISM="Synedropsis recta cf, Strain CCMP1620" /LENGTH=250 /DNA_ID=CAMNT_0006957927 /DNA_START=155 /DNA_END=907 /DNA_ORIENTATION=+
MSDSSDNKKTDIDAGTDDVHVSRPDARPKKKTKKNKRRPASTLNSETVRVYISSVLLRLSERISLETLRPLPLFIGITDHAFCLSAGAFTPPTSTDSKTVAQSIRTRIALNGAFFLTNYALVAFGVAVVVALLHPGMLLVCGVVWLLWWMHDYLITHEVNIGKHNFGTLVSINNRSSILTIVTFGAVVWKCLFPVLSFVLVSGVLLLLHAVMRDPQHIASCSQYGAGGSADGADDFNSDDEVMVERGDVI